MRDKRPFSRTRTRAGPGKEDDPTRARPRGESRKSSGGSPSRGPTVREWVRPLTDLETFGGKHSRPPLGRPVELVCISLHKRTVKTFPRHQALKAAIFGSALIAVLVVSAAVFEVTDDPDPDIRVATEEETALDTATGLAEELGISVEKALSRGEYQLAFTDFIDEIQGLLPGDVWAGASLNDDGISGVMRFKGDVPAAVSAALVESSLGGIELRGGMEFSRAEAQERAVMVLDAALALGLSDVSSTFSSETQRVHLYLGPRDTSLPEGLALREALVKKVAGRAGGAEHRLSVDDIDVTEDEERATSAHSFGGAQMNYTSGADNCTSAFSVEKNDTLVDGVLTASHCENVRKIEENDTSGGKANPPSTNPFDAPWKEETYSTVALRAYGDIEWHTTSHIEKDDFWSAVPVLWDVSSRISNAAITSNAYICKFGRTTARTCGFVSDEIFHSFTVYWSYCDCDIIIHQIVEVDDPVVDRGDSGGPVFSNNQAWGITHGFKLNPYRLYFSTIENAELAFNLHIKK